MRPWLASRWELEFSALFPHSLKRGWKRSSYLIMPLWRSLHKTLTPRSFGRIQIGEHIRAPKEWRTLTPQGQKFLCSGPFWTLPFLHLVVHLYHYILYNKPVNTNQGFPEFYEPLQRMTEPEKGIRGTPNLQPVGLKYRGKPRTCDWHLKWGTILWDWSLNRWGLC